MNNIEICFLIMDIVLLMGIISMLGLIFFYFFRNSLNSTYKVRCEQLEEENKMLKEKMSEIKKSMTVNAHASNVVLNNIRRILEI